MHFRQPLCLFLRQRPSLVLGACETFRQDLNLSLSSAKDDQVCRRTSYLVHGNKVYAIGEGILLILSVVERHRRPVVDIQWN